ncbi:MAG TPA: cyclic nucleotide-binding domain-containing protein [Thermoanaerobaculia bacterium]|nr:cyclic nucleotide-binding domain-containing protein [Thermoanaerobaculia bacterium]
MRKVLFVFGQLADDDVEWLLAHGRRRRLVAGEALIRQGEPIDDVFIVLTGRLRVVLGGERREIALLGAGEIVGEMSFVDARPPSATVEAVEPAQVFAVPRSRLAARLESEPAFAARFYRALAIYLSTTVRERHRMLLAGGVTGGGEDDADELDATVLDGVSQAGARFDRLVKRVLAS